MRNKFVFQSVIDPKAKAKADQGEIAKIQARQQEIEAFLDGKKQERKQAAATAHVRLEQDMKVAKVITKNIHPALHAYEVATLSIGSETIQDIKVALVKLHPALLFGPTQSGITPVHEHFSFQPQPGKPKATLNDEATRHLGNIREGNARFAPLDPQPPGALNQVFRRGNDVGPAARHYIRMIGKDTQGRSQEVFVRRYVVRGLSGQNSIEIGKGHPLTSAHQGAGAKQTEIVIKDDANSKTKYPVDENTPLGMKYQLISHARGWAKRFLSTGVGNRLPYSTRGEHFNSIFGQVVVDLAYVEAKTIYDLHSPQAVLRELNMDASVVLSQKHFKSSAATEKDEEYLALRDVLRTRELLILESVKFNAVKFQFSAPRNTILGIGFPTSYYKEIEQIKRKDPVVSLLWKNLIGAETDTLDYAALHHKKWLYIRYQTEGDCSAAHDFAWKYYPSKEVYLEVLTHCAVPAALPGFVVTGG